MYPILFKIQGFTFYTHGLLAVLGIIFGALVLFFLAKKANLKNELLFDDVIYSVFAGIVGARLTFFFLYREQFSSLKELFFIWDGGMVSYGGFLLGGLAFYLLLRYQKELVLPWLDIISIAFSFGLVFGRIGNIFAGEYSGVITTSKLNLGGLVPVTLYEAILLVIIFCIFILYYLKNERCKNGLIFSTFLILYGTGRFIIDIWRDESNLIFNISLGQIVSLLVAAFGIILIIRLGFKNRKVKHGIAG